jgi:hypothetical protein
MADAESQTGRRPQILLMQNHGLIITVMTPDSACGCMKRSINGWRPRSNPG